MMPPRRRARARRPTRLALAAGTLAAVLLVLAGCTAIPVPPTPGPTAPRIHGWLRAHGQRLVDSTGITVRLQGIDVTGMGKGVGAPGQQGTTLTGCPGWKVPPQSEFDNIQKWGFNSVRIPISWANLEPTRPAAQPDGTDSHQYNTQYLSALDEIVRQFSQRGIAVIIEMAQSQWSPAFKNVVTDDGSKCQGVGMPAWLYPGVTPDQQTQARLDFFQNRQRIQQQYAGAWRFVAGHFANDPTVVGFDMFNEPYTKGTLTPAELDLDGLYRRLGGAIRSVNSKALLIFQDSNFPDDNAPLQTGFALHGPPPYHGVVYSFHMYSRDWNPDGLRKVEAYYQRASRWKVPLYMGEFDAFGYGGPRSVNSNWHSELLQMLQYLRKRSINWNFFTYADRWLLDSSGSGIPKPGLLESLWTDFPKRLTPSAS